MLNNDTTTPQPPGSLRPQANAEAYRDGDKVIVSMFGRPFSLPADDARKLAWDLVRVFTTESESKNYSGPLQS